MITYSPRASVPLVGFDQSLLAGYLNFDRVLFLDFDGVLHPEGCDADLHFCFMHNFAEVLREVDPKGEMPIVVSSMWRLDSTISQLRSNFRNDIAHQIVGVTPDLLDEGSASAGAWNMENTQLSRVGSRQREVLDWMKRFAPAGQWLAVDDWPNYFSINCQNLFVVPGLNSGLGAGLNVEAAESLKTKLLEFVGSGLAETLSPSMCTDRST